MWLKSHRWVDVPGTRTEKRWSMNVRESTHSAMVFDKKYLNIETGKFDTDKLHTLNSLSLIDLMSGDDNGNWINTYVRQAKRDRGQQVENVYNFPKHVPKDNDFDAEIEREKRKKEWLAKQESARIEEEAVRNRYNEQHEKARIYYEEKRRKDKEQEISYAKQLAETEEKLMKERNERFERMQQANHIRHTGNVRPNVWRPK